MTPAEEYYQTISHREHLDKAEALKLLELYMQEHGLEDWKGRISESLPLVLAGRCYHFTKTIWLEEYGIIHIYTPEQVKETVLHEIAHALMPHMENHGKNWQAKALEIGLSPEHIFGVRRDIEKRLRGRTKAERKWWRELPEEQKRGWLEVS